MPCINAHGHTSPNFAGRGSRRNVVDLVFVTMYDWKSVGRILIHQLNVSNFLDWVCRNDQLGVTNWHRLFFPLANYFGLIQWSVASHPWRVVSQGILGSQQLQRNQSIIRYWNKRLMCSTPGSQKCVKNHLSSSIRVTYANKCSSVPVNPQTEDWILPLYPNSFDRIGWCSIDS